MLSLVFLFFTIWCSTSECVLNLEPSPCPAWLYRPSPQGECICGSDLQGAVTCNTGNYHSINVVKNFCILLRENINSTVILIGTCPYGNGGLLSDYNKWICGAFHRRGQLCGACVENYTLSVYSYYFGCVECEDYKYGWLKFITVAFLPLTLFYILVIIFQISVTLSSLNGVVLVSQIAATPSIIHEMNSHNHDSPFVNTVIAVYAIWNLDFFRSFYKPICLYPDLKYQHALLLDYAVAVYPLLLIFITFICVKLHDNLAIVVWVWRPFHKCLVQFRKQWNIRSYLVNALATFIVLSYVKILNVSFQFLTSSHVYDIKGQQVNKGYWYYDGRVDMTSTEYMPYLVLALSMLMIFNVFPLVLLTLYPFKFFQVFLDCCPCLKCKLALRLFMDTFHGCYKDSEHDYRHFAALYLAVRFFNLLLILILRSFNAYIIAATLLFVIVLTLVAKFQPYKQRRNNSVDIVMFFTLITGSVAAALRRTVGLQYPKWVFGIIITGIALIPPGYLLCLVIAHIKPKASQYFNTSKIFLLERMSRAEDDRGAEDPALLNQKVTDYNAIPKFTEINVVYSQ